MGRWLYLLDDEKLARHGLPGMARDVEWALPVIHDVGRWQTPFFG